MTTNTQRRKLGLCVNCDTPVQHPHFRCPPCHQARQPADEPAPPPRTPGSRWRCREHPDHEVTWKGKGCKACANQGDGWQAQW